MGMLNGSNKPRQWIKIILPSSNSKGWPGLLSRHAALYLNTKLHRARPLQLSDKIIRIMNGLYGLVSAGIHVYICKRLGYYVITFDN